MGQGFGIWGDRPLISCEWRAGVLQVAAQPKSIVPGLIPGRTRKGARNLVPDYS